jgi:hypothetical protein
MPNLGLSREDVTDILAHIETRTSEVRDRQALAEAAQPAPAGEPGSTQHQHQHQHQYQQQQQQQQLKKP